MTPEALVGLGLGANLGDPSASLRRALALLRGAGLKIEAVSSLYATAPWGVTDQPDFVNACALARTGLAPLALLDLLKETEQAMGRRETLRWGPRVIDIDLLFYDDVAWRDARLTLPHPGLFERAFVLLPLAEVAPGLSLPGRGTVEAEARRLGEQRVARLA